MPSVGVGDCVFPAGPGRQHATDIRMISRMDVFGLRDALIADYADYVRGFMRLRDQRINEHVERGISAGRLWPDPSIGLNPTFAPGGWIDDLVGEGLLHPACADIFRVNKRPDTPLGERLRLHSHQEDAIRRAGAGRSFVLTTGTGSGKSLGYIVPAVDHVLRTGSGQGIKALIVYPMNALANSQVEELDKFLGPTGGAAPVSYGKYTCQAIEDVRHDRIISDGGSIPDVARALGRSRRSVNLRRHTRRALGEDIPVVVVAGRVYA